MSWVMWTARLVDAAGSWEIEASCADCALEVMFGAIGVRTDLSASFQVTEVMLVASYVFHCSTFASRPLTTVRAHFTVVFLWDRGFAGAAGSSRMGACTDVTLGVVSMAPGMRKGSDCDVHGRAWARGKGLPGGKYRISACDMCNGASGPLTGCC